MYGGCILKNCASQLADSFIFKLSVYHHRVPGLWKDSTITPEPKNNAPKSLNDYRPVVLTSLVMKTFEKIVKEALMNTEEANLVPLQFAYRCGRVVAYATGTLLKIILAPLIFIEFSSAFNCIQAHFLAERLKSIHNNDHGLVVGF